MAILTLESNGQTLSVNGSFTYETTPIVETRQGQSFFTADGNYHSLFSQMERISLTLFMRDVYPSTWVQIRTFIEKIIVFQLNEVSVSVSGLDLGNGQGNPVNCFYRSNTTKEIPTLKQPKIFDLKMEFIK